MRSRLGHYIAHFFISFSFDPYCMTELFSSLSWIGYTSKTYSTNPLWNGAALLYTTVLWVQLPEHTVWFVYVCECQCDELNTDEAAARDHLHTTLTLGAFCILYPLFITSSSFPFNLCRQGRHQSEWQVVWSSFRAWWEKERCQHKYPSWMHGGHGAATATMNRHPLSQAEKTRAHQHGWKTTPSPANATLSPLSATNKQNCQFIACAWLFAHFYFHTGRLAAMSSSGLTFTHKKYCTSVPTLTHTCSVSAWILM